MVGLFVLKRYGFRVKNFLLAQVLSESVTCAFKHFGSLQTSVKPIQNFRFKIGVLFLLTFTFCVDRIFKTWGHEFGNMFTIQHCIHGVCVMNGSNSLFETD